MHADIEDGVITCLGHGMSWDLTTGKGVNNPFTLGSCTAAQELGSCLAREGAVMAGAVQKEPFEPPECEDPSG